METLPLITIIFSLTSFAALIWLIVRAFKTKLLWGFAVLLLSPVSAILFGVKYWEHQKKPFLLYISTFTATFALSIYLFAVIVDTEKLRLSNALQPGMQQNTQAKYGIGELLRASFSVGDISAEDGMFRQDPDFANRHVSANSPGEITTETAAQETARGDNGPAVKDRKTVRYRLKYIPIKLTEIKNHIGTTAKITRKNVEEKEYMITGASPMHIELAQRSTHGKFSFHFKNSDIENIRVLVREPY
ncbi:MAG: hypothetical protein WBN90_03690 [Gammaproteobacteria bacterium]